MFSVLRVVCGGFLSDADREKRVASSGGVCRMAVSGSDGSILAGQC